MTTSDLRGLAEQLGLWTGTNWMLTAFPAWMLILVPFILSIGLFLVLRTCVEWQIPYLHRQYMGFWPGNAFLSLGLGLLIVGMAFYASPPVDAFWRSMAWNLLTLLVSLGGTMALFFYEFINAFRNRKFTWPDDKAYTLYQLFTPTAIAYRFSMFALIYLFMKVGVVALSTGAVPWTLKLASIILMGAWAVCVIRDNTHTRPNLSDVYPTTGAWFRIGRKSVSSTRPAAPASASPAAPFRSDSDWPGSTALFGADPLPTDTGSFGYTGRAGDTMVGNFGAQSSGYRADDAPVSGYDAEPMPARRDTAPGERTTALPPFDGRQPAARPQQPAARPPRSEPQGPGHSRSRVRTSPTSREEGERGNNGDDGGAKLPAFKR